MGPKTLWSLGIGEIVHEITEHTEEVFFSQRLLKRNEQRKKTEMEEDNETNKQTNLHFSHRPYKGSDLNFD